MQDKCTSRKSGEITKSTMFAIVACILAFYIGVFLKHAAPIPPDKPKCVSKHKRAKSSKLEFIFGINGD